MKAHVRERRRKEKGNEFTLFAQFHSLPQNFVSVCRESEGGDSAELRPGGAQVGADAPPAAEAQEVQSCGREGDAEAPARERDGLVREHLGHE